MSATPFARLLPLLGLTLLSCGGDVYAPPPVSTGPLLVRARFDGTGDYAAVFQGQTITEERVELMLPPGRYEMSGDFDGCLVVSFVSRDGGVQQYSLRSLLGPVARTGSCDIAYDSGGLCRGERTAFRFQFVVTDSNEHAC